MRFAKRFRGGANAAIEKKMEQLGAYTGAELLAICTDKSRASQDRVQSCALLGQLKLREATSLLIRIAMGEVDERLVWESLSAVGAIGSRKATRPLLGILQAGTPGAVRRGAVFALMQLADERARGMLVRIAAGAREEEKIRGLATEALGMLRPRRRSLRFLIEALHDPCAEVRFASLCALGALREHDALPFIRPLLSDTTVVDGDESVGDRAAVVLRSIEDAVSLIVRPRLRRSEVRRRRGRRVLRSWHRVPVPR